ncbi:MAG: phenylalanine--tRNA ligase beta subunit [Acidimicrobiia bacterium]
MRVPLSWIRDFTPVDTRVDDALVDSLVGALNSVGLEVDGVERPGREVRGVRVARILDVVPHPDADKLRLADVDFGDGQTRVVCGAPNISPGMVVPFAPVGATLPGGFVLERRKIRGQVSDGMLCSAKELGLGDDHAGILELDATTEPGLDIRTVLGLDDVIFDLAITPNRPDAMCVVGVAREIAAYYRLPFLVPEAHAPRAPDVATSVPVVVEAPERCPRYLAWVAEVTVGPSPAWMQERLVKAGVRAINNVVDVTNYVLLERNQPLHAFDLDRLAGPGIVVRLAADGESITTLDGVERALAGSDLLIGDGDRVPQAVAGIMGGGGSEVSGETTRILLEAAYFERMGIARTSKRLKLRSESSARFERGTDPDAVAAAATRAMELLVEVAAARVAPDPVDEYPHPAVRPVIRLRTSKVNGVLGTQLTDTEIVTVLRPLGIDVSGSGEVIEAVPPTFRPDLEREIDLVEEVARGVGFAAIGRTVPRPEHQVGGLTPAQQARRTAGDVLVGAGLAEVVTIPLISPAAATRFGAGEPVGVANPLRAEESVLRPTLLPGLVSVAAHNLARGRHDVAVFELGRVFLPPEGDELLPREPEHVAALLCGARRRSPVEFDRPVDAYDASDLVWALRDALGVAGLRFVPAEWPGFDPQATARVLAGTVTVGVLGRVAPAAIGASDLVAPVVALELDLDALVSAPRLDRQFRPLSPFPSSAIDLAFVVPSGVLAADVVATLEDAGGALVEHVRCFDEYRGAQLGEGRRSLAFALRYRAPDRTLTDTEVADLRRGAIAAVEAAHDAVLRA